MSAQPWPSTLLAMLVVGPATFAAAGPEAVVFEQPEDVVLLWAKRACVMMTLLSVTLVAFVLLFRRSRLMEAPSKLLLFLGICVLPVPVTFLSGGIGMEESKAVSFCAACHLSMGPFVRDMEDPRSETLAAVHYKNRYLQREQCWNCHSDYGIAGTASAKKTGLVHIVKYTANTWRPPIRLFHPYKWRICLGCHAASALFQTPRGDPAAHDGVLQAVVKGEMGCADCHALAHPAPAERSTR
jgi:nitrate/TMAO reductase-like tetraheme cytochrome c subunit